MAAMCTLCSAGLVSCRTGNDGNREACLGSKKWHLDNGWLAFEEFAGTPPVAPAVNIMIADRGWFIPNGEPIPQTVREAANGAVESVYIRPFGELVDCYSPFPELGPGAIRRRVTFTNTGAERVDLLETRMGVNRTLLNPIWQPTWFRMFGKEGDPRMLCIANWGENDTCQFRGGEGHVAGVFRSCWRLEGGQSATIGCQVIWGGDGSRTDCRKHEAERFYAAIGFDQPITYPDWLTGGILYEASAGGHIDSRFSDTGGFDTFGRQIPYLADLGVTALWLNAVQSHKTSPNPVKGGWNLYDPRDFMAVEPVFGGEAGFARLGKTLQSNGIHLISETVPHGGHSVQAEALPDWWTRDRDGKLRKNWGGFGMDNASPDWQAVQRASLASLARLAPIEGIRIDVAGGQGPHWGSPHTNHASRSGMIGSRELFRALAEGIASGGATSRPLLIPEAAARPEYFAIPGAVSLGYGFETTHFIERLGSSVLVNPQALNRELRKHFEQQRWILPPGALSVQSLNNHDTVCHSGRAMFRFGAGLHRALYAVCIAVPGIPMMYQEEEVGSFFALQRLNHVRQELPWLASAEAVYPSTEDGDARVFTVFRHDGKHSLLCVVNLSGEDATVRMDWPSQGRGEQPKALLDVSSRETRVLPERGCVVWDLPPYGSAFLMPSPVKSPLPKKTHTADSLPLPLTFLATDGGLEFRSGETSFRLELPGEFRMMSRSQDHPEKTTFTGPSGTIILNRRGAAFHVVCDFAASATNKPPTFVLKSPSQWAVSGRTALLHDRVLRRHYPFPEGVGYRWERHHTWGLMPNAGLYGGVCPSGRLWQSVVEPLHPEEPALAFALADVGKVLISDIETDAMNVVLTDGADEGLADSGELYLRFHAVDPDLHPAVQRMGIRPFWRLQSPQSVPNRPLHLAFMVSMDMGDLTSRLRARRLPVNLNGPVERREGARFPNMGGRLFMPEPGLIEWSNLPAVEGRFSLEFELRLSEKSGEDTDLAEAYHITLDGKELPLTWTKKNVWSTGNAFFAKAVSSPVDLEGGHHVLTVKTNHTWCALLPQVTLLP